MPHAAEVGPLVFELLHFDHVGMLRHALHEWVASEYAEALAKRDKRCGRKRLFTKEYDEVLEQSLANERNLIIGEVARKIDAADLGAKGTYEWSHRDGAVHR